jgi:hypothetical protein
LGIEALKGAGEVGSNHSVKRAYEIASDDAVVGDVREWFPGKHLEPVRR